MVSSNTFSFSFTDTGVGKLTVGKLYGGILIHENWRNTKFGSIEELRKQEAEIEELEERRVIIQEELVWISIYDENGDENGQLKQYEDIINEQI